MHVYTDVHYIPGRTRIGGHGENEREGSRDDDDDVQTMAARAHRPGAF